MIIGNLNLQLSIIFRTSSYESIFVDTAKTDPIWVSQYHLVGDVRPKNILKVICVERTCLNQNGFGKIWFLNVFFWPRLCLCNLSLILLQTEKQFRLYFIFIWMRRQQTFLDGLSFFPKKRTNYLIGSGNHTSVDIGCLGILLLERKVTVPSCAIY